VCCAELCTLKAFGSCIMSFSVFVMRIASLYAGLSFQLTVGRFEWLFLCNFVVPYMCGALGFKFLYFHFVALLIKLFFDIIFSTFMLYSFLCTITMALPLSSFVTIRWFWIIFFALLIRFLSCISCCVFKVALPSFRVFFFVDNFCKVFATVSLCFKTRPSAMDQL
jgi:hypothetical protein